MSYPVGIITRPVRVLPAVTVESGDTITTKVTVKASRSLVWIPTLTPVVADQNIIVNEGTGPVDIDLPVTDQNGYGNGSGLVYDVTDGQQTHTYSVVIQHIRNNVLLGEAKVIAAAHPEGDGSPVPITAFVPSQSDGGATIVIPDAWSTSLAAAEAAAQAAEAAALAAAAAAGNVDRVTTSAAGSVYSINLIQYDLFAVTLTQDCTFELQGLVPGRSFTVEVSQDATGGHELTLPTHQGTVVIDPTPLSINTLVCYSTDGINLRILQAS